MRLDRYISKSLGVSRKDAKKIILSGRVRVNGRVVKDPSVHVEEDSIEFDGEKLEKPSEKIYLMLNKPPGFVSSTRDSQPTVLDLIDHPRVGELFPVGRLDKDARGMLILTNDGKFAHRVISPKNHLEKEYEVAVDKDPKDALKLLEGVLLRDGHFAKAINVEIVGKNVVRIVIDEGKYHQVKRMMAAVGLKVLDLKRVRIGGLELDIDEGEWRELSEEDLKKLKGEK